MPNQVTPHAEISESLLGNTPFLSEALTTVASTSVSSTDGSEDIPITLGEHENFTTAPTLLQGGEDFQTAPQQGQESTYYGDFTSESAVTEAALGLLNVAQQRPGAFSLEHEGNTSQETQTPQSEWSYEVCYQQLFQQGSLPTSQGTSLQYSQDHSQTYPQPQSRFSSQTVSSQGTSSPQMGSQQMGSSTTSYTSSQRSQQPMTAVDFTQRQDLLSRRYHSQMQDHHYSQLQSHRTSNTNMSIQPTVTNHYLPQQQQEQYNTQVALPANQQLDHLNQAVAVPRTLPRRPRPVRRQEERKHECSTCGRKFLRPSALKTHGYTHTGIRLFPCPFVDCNRHVEGSWFSVLSNKTRHVVGKHKGATPPPYPEGFILGEHTTFPAPAPAPEQEEEEMQVEEAQE